MILATGKPFYFVGRMFLGKDTVTSNKTADKDEK